MRQQNNQEIVVEKLTEKAREILERNEMVRRQDSIFIKMLPDEEILLEFNPELVEVTETNFAGTTKRKLQYVVIDNETKKRKYWTVNHRTSALIDSYPANGQWSLRVKRIGSGIDTRYEFSSP